MAKERAAYRIEYMTLNKARNVTKKTNLIIICLYVSKYKRNLREKNKVKCMMMMMMMTPNGVKYCGKMLKRAKDIEYS